MIDRGWVWSEERRQLEKRDFPVQILSPDDDLEFHPSRYEDKQGNCTVSLGDLISMKLGSGCKYVHRAQDLADVVRLIEILKLDKGFTGRVVKSDRKEFQRLVDAVRRRE